jgi:hypothetical protein
MSIRAACANAAFPVFVKPSIGLRAERGCGLTNNIKQNAGHSSEFFLKTFRSKNELLYRKFLIFQIT